MAFAGVMGWISRIEPILWLVIFIIYAVIIALRTTEKRFGHAFLVSILNGFWIAIIHSVFFATYMENNPDMADSYTDFPSFVPPRVMMLIAGPVIGVLTGLIAGFFAWRVGRLIKPSTPKQVQ